MNHVLWAEHLAARVAELEAELARTREKHRRQRQRAEYWSARALTAHKPVPYGRVTASTRQSRPAGTRARWAKREDAA